MRGGCPACAQPRCLNHWQNHPGHPAYLQPDGRTRRLSYRGLVIMRPHAFPPTPIGACPPPPPSPTNTSKLPDTVIRPRLLQNADGLHASTQSGALQTPTYLVPLSVQDYCVHVLCAGAPLSPPSLALAAAHTGRRPSCGHEKLRRVANHHMPCPSRLHAHGNRCATSASYWHRPTTRQMKRQASMAAGTFQIESVVNVLWKHLIPVTLDPNLRPAVCATRTLFRLPSSPTSYSQGLPPQPT